jgi:hypothetical protein
LYLNAVHVSRQPLAFLKGSRSRVASRQPSISTSCYFGTTCISFSGYWQCFLSSLLPGLRCFLCVSMHVSLCEGCAATRNRSVLHASVVCVCVCDSSAEKVGDRCHLQPRSHRKTSTRHCITHLSSLHMFFTAFFSIRFNIPTRSRLDSTTTRFNQFTF